MIRLIIFAPCEKIIIGKDNHSSLISVMEHINLKGAIDPNMPANAGMPYKWSVFALWHREREVLSPTDYEAKIELISPSGLISVGGSSLFTVSNQHVNYRSVFEFPIFPIAEPGIHSLKLFLKQKNTKDFEQIGEYPILLIHAPTQVTKKESNEKIVKKRRK